MKVKPKHLKPNRFRRMTLKNKILMAIVSLSLIICLTVGGSASYAYLVTPKSSDEVSFSKSTIVAPTVSHDNAVSSAAMVPGGSITVNSYVKANSGTNVATYLFAKVTKSSNVDTYLSYTYDSGWTKDTTNSTSTVDILYRKLAASATGTYYIYSSKAVTVKSATTKSDTFTSAKPTITVTAAIVQQDARTAAQAYTTVSSFL